MTPYLSDLLAEMNGADLVACGILALLARWHSRQVRQANKPVRWEDRK